MEKINIAEILKYCPKGMELDCTMYEDVTLILVLEGNAYPIKIKTPDGQVSLDKYGRYSSNKHAKCVIFPKGKNTWEGFVPPCKFNDGDVIYVKTRMFKWVSIFKNDTENKMFTYADYNLDNNNFYSSDKEAIVLCLKREILEKRIATEEEKQKLFKAIKDNGYKWNADTNTLVELPKFHEGDWIMIDKPCKIISIIDNGNYIVQYCDDEKTHLLTKKFCESHFHLWTIQDAKDGDVLFHSDSASNGIFIFKEISQRGTTQKVICYCDYDSEDGFCLGENHTCCWADSKILHPATKEQCDILFQKMKKAGYEWNAETKTLNVLTKPKFNDGDILYAIDEGKEFIFILKHIFEHGKVYCYLSLKGDDLRIQEVWLTDYNSTHRLATEEEKLKLFKAIKDNGYKWNADTKSLETLPKFKVGDIIERFGCRYTITEIRDNYYLTKCGDKIRIDNQDVFELAPNKFDVTTLKPFDKVLVRTKSCWTIDFFDGYQPEIGGDFTPFGVSGGKYYQQCIPYEGNEHLRATTNDCDEYYKNW